MPLLKCDFFSEALMLSTSMTVILPKKSGEHSGRKSSPVLYLLHGYSDDHTAWTRRTSIERYAEDMGIVVVMPQVDHSYYTDMASGNRYWTFLTEEIPNTVHSMFHLSEKREDNFVAGLSMGGYGAFKWALRYPEKFSAAASLSGALDVSDLLDRVSDNDRKKEFIQIFGEQPVRGTENDLLELIKQGNGAKQLKPMLYQSCGTEDFLYNDNITFKKVCEETDYKLETEFEPGDHNWGYWDKKIQDVLNWLPIQN
ncbi:esterase [Virgibacillus profundi]|uniref:Esterase n=1 Tax=Virgibacillus profundi TaxID=2024555 RepID=A0A2A2IIN0_9BACI|nr:alpha/beta hydrolase family protein [Virgibacillus profundi]PAV31238.1 esterase [Virgibacillus profundi]PXY55423.1 esterase family protein [Virgibacillus profundi]